MVLLPAATAQAEHPQACAGDGAQVGCGQQVQRLGGDVYVDGSRIQGAAKWSTRASLMRAGIGIAVTSAPGTWDALASAPLIYPYQDINPAELYASLRVLIHSGGMICIVSDSGFFVDGFEKGPAWCTEASRPCADLWRAFWDKAIGVGLKI